MFFIPFQWILYVETNDCFVLQINFCCSSLCYTTIYLTESSSPQDLFKLLHDDTFKSYKIKEKKTNEKVSGYRNLDKIENFLMTQWIDRELKVTAKEEEKGVSEEIVMRALNENNFWKVLFVLSSTCQENSTNYLYLGKLVEISPIKLHQAATLFRPSIH